MSTPQPLVNQGRFRDFNLLNQATRGWDLDVRQLERGPLEAEMLQVGGPSCFVTRVTLNRGFDQSGAAPEGIRTFGLIDDGVSGVRWCDRVLFLIDVGEIDDVAQTFKCDVLVTVTWQDSRLRLSPDARDPVDRVVGVSEIWNPELTLINRRSVQAFSPDVARIAPDGRVTIETRRFAEFASPLDLHEFPFDTQKLRIDVASTRCGPEEIELSLDRETTGRLEPFSIAGWEVSVSRGRRA